MTLSLTVGTSDVTSYLEADSLSIEQVAGAFAAVCSFRLKEVGEPVLSVASRANVLVVDSGTLFAGEVVDVDWDVMAIGQSGRRMTLHCRDWQSWLEETVIAGGTAYAAQSDASILNVLFTNYLPAVNAVTYVTELAPSLTVEFANETLLDALEKIGGQTGGKWYIDEAKNLHYFSTENSTAAWHLSDTPDGGTSFGFQSISGHLDADAIVNQVFVVGDGVTGWVEAGSSVALYGERQAILTDTNITTVGSANARGSAFLARWKDPRVSYNATIRKAGLRAGMDIRLRVQDWDVDDTLTIKRQTISWHGHSRLRIHELELGDGVAASVSSGRGWEIGRAHV